MHSTTTTDIPSVAPLDAFGAADLETVGGKAANLGELIRAGLPVPPGFVVTTEAYAAVAANAGPDTLPGTPGADGDGPAPATLRTAVREATVPDGLRDAIATAYRGLGPDTPVAVRSSATAEDLPGAAFAGQQDTYLNVVGVDAVMDAVRRCWASLWTDRAVAYRRERAIDPGRVRIAVIVQEMVDARVAGVMFTADPVSGDRDRIIVDAGAGLGEAVVSGLVTPDHYVLDRRGSLLEWTPGRDETVIRPAAGGGVRATAASDATGPRAGEDAAAHEVGPRTGEGPDGALLGPDRLSVLVAYARTIAAHFGRPQDIEWALTGDRLRVVQTRPMTALPPPSVPLDRRQRLQASILTEYLPVRPYPMDVSTFVAHGPADMMREIAEYYGLEGAFRDYLREEDGVVVRLVPPSPRPAPRALWAPVVLVRKARRFRPADWAEDPRQRAFLDEVAALEAVDPRGLPWAELVRMPGRALGLLTYCRDLRIDYLPGSGLALARLALALRLLGRGGLLPDLLGGARTRTEDADRALADLAATVREDPDLRALFTEHEPSGVMAALDDGRFPEWRAAWERFLREYGRRETTSPLLVSPPTLAESPEVVLGLVRSLVDGPAPTDDAVSRSREALASLLDHPLLRGRRAERRVRRLLRAAQEAVAFREDTHFFFTAMLPTLRRALLEIGARLCRVGVVEDPFDVFHLRLEEVTEAGDPDTLGQERRRRLRSLVRARAAKRAELAGVPMIDPARVFPRRTSADALVTGSAAGAGTATGPVRIIRGAAEFHRLQDGDVLVCPCTNPSWTPLFRRAAAVVVDSGAIASHAAIVAREYGIPAVMGTGTGTSVLTDGTRVTVDGSRGLVTAAS
ncbi:PEP/pyruvate-binding domain-containing protein [Nocardiopsis sp. MG754419]|uniref:PEP/pyruvate-binding domain-containing protein n=1 Tax=Nocardiopsis sp. MG754419 TaxID=2259865 RepID=UPI001BA99F93|nr:PEP/pyruvate-binding domain-containing protein [Nocardiopsis sp. MG754419]MBR8744667.1 phosphoenolpyruvate synthase [Nocardiopsis sp. MG754419]